jgi:hypothetical protein
MTQVYRFDVPEIVHSAVENMTPDRCINPVLRPDRPIGEADFAANCFQTAFLVHLSDERRHAISIVDRQPIRTRGERRNLSCAVKRTEGLGRDRMKGNISWLIHGEEILILAGQRRVFELDDAGIHHSSKKRDTRVKPAYGD